jgi:aryl-alcohol dehydrogenase-like predicted oxidoreductase
MAMAMAMTTPRPVGMGAMRLSTRTDRDDARGLAVLVGAIDAGVTLIDTADAYALTDADVGHNERLVAAARAARPDAGVTVVTKGGLTRPGGAWIPDGRARHLAAAARASAERLGGAPLDLYLLHAPDPNVPFATSVRALAKLVDDGVARAVGVSNVDRTRLAEALDLAPISAVSVELSPFRTTALAGGVLDLCAERGLLVLAHRPLGGVTNVRRLARHPCIAPIIAATGLDPVAATIAWLRTLGPRVVPLPGTTGDGFTSFNPPPVEIPATSPETVSTSSTSDAADGDVVVLLGPPGAGKSTIAAELVAAGYARLNRDELGGSLARLAVRLDGALAGGERRVVLDNTYPARALRAPVIAAARRYGVGVRCIELATSIEDAQVNAVKRLLDRYGHLPGPEELATLGKRDPNTFAPSAQFRWRRQYEPPSTDEGFGSVERREFVRTPAIGGRPAVIVELDDVVWTGRPTTPEGIRLVDGAHEHLARWADGGWLVLATTWMPDAADPDGVLAALRVRLPMILAIERCTHPAGPPVCWCRKPLPGMGLALQRSHGVDLGRSYHLGDGPADRTFAARLGLTFTRRAADIPTSTPA